MGDLLTTKQNFNDAISDASSSYSPTVTIPGGTDPTFGTVTFNSASFQKITGKLYRVHWTFQHISAGTAGSGGDYVLSLPPTLSHAPNVVSEVRLLGSATMFGGGVTTPAWVAPHANGVYFIIQKGFGPFTSDLENFKAGGAYDFSSTPLQIAATFFIEVP